jgi:rhamnogalacturonyl hydrolase YesR
MTISSFHTSLRRLKNYCETQSFKGWDPYDGLNSKIFKVTPLKDWDIARLIWIQVFKRSPINFRKVMFVPKDYNTKGIGLFLTAYSNLYKNTIQTGDNSFGSSEDILNQIIKLSDLLISMQSKGYSGSCWGYNFDWQARRLFLFPKGTPNVVATTFCASALFEAYEITKNDKYLSTAILSADFILNDLKRTKINKGFLFSYSPLDGNNTVYNASLLASKLLSICYSYTNNEAYIKAARESVIACVDAQKENGSWVYGALPVQSWIDSFHTGYNLDGLIAYQNYSGDKSFDENIKRGFEYYINNFFMDDGTPKYYHNKVYPIDIHCPAQLFVTLNRLNSFTQYQVLAEKVMEWTIKYMQTQTGYFIYQKKQLFSSKIPYMRWSQAFMFCAMSFYLLSISKKIE